MANNTFDNGLRVAAILVTRRARQHEEALAEIDDQNSDEACMHAAEAQGLRAAAADILALILDTEEASNA